MNEFPDIHKLQVAIYMYKPENHSEFERQHSYITINRYQPNPTFSRLSIGQRSLNILAAIKQAKSLTIYKQKKEEIYSRSLFDK